MTICDGISCDECSFNICENGKSGCLLDERISKLPPVTPTRKRGKWIDCGEQEPWYRCSECRGKTWGSYKKYCPNCGARMESEV